MRKALTLLYLFFSLLVLSPTAHYAAGLDVNDTTSGKGEPFSGDHSADGFEVTPRNGVSSGREISPVSEMTSSKELSSGIDYDYAEEYDNEPQISGYIVDDSVRGEWRIRQKHSLEDVCVCMSKAHKRKAIPWILEWFSCVYVCCISLGEAST